MSTGSYFAVTGIVSGGGSSSNNDAALKNLSIRLNTLLLDFSKLVGTVEGLNSLSGRIDDINKNIASLTERVVVLENKLKNL